MHTTNNATLAEVLAGLSAWTYDTMRLGYDYQLNPSEETLTDMLLIYFRENAKRVTNCEVATKKYAKAEETINGADWLWHILHNGKMLRLLIQAKKVTPAADPFERNRYEKLYDRGHSLPQVEKLIEFAKTNSLTPLYVLYNYIKYSNAPLPTQPWEIGCRVAHADKVRDEIKSDHPDRCTFESMSGFTSPWNEIVNLQASANGRDGNIVESLARTLESTIGANHQMAVENHVPAYVLELLQQGDTQHPLPVPVDAVVVVEFK